MRQSWNKEALAGGLCCSTITRRRRPAKPGLSPSNAESQTVKAPHSRLIPEKTVLSNAFGLIGKDQITLSDHTRKLLSLFHMVLLPVDHLADPQPLMWLIQTLANIFYTGIYGATH